MAGKQIKRIRIETESIGAVEATRELATLQEAMKDIAKSSADFAGVAGRLSPSLSNLAKSGEKLGATATNLKTVGASLKAINSAAAGTDTQTKKLDGYITNLEVLTSVLLEVGAAGNQAEAALEGLGDVSGLKSLVSVLERIETNTGKAAIRIKETRDNISDLDVTTNRAGEELQDMSVQARRAAAAQKALGGTSTQTTAAMKQTTKAVNNQTKSFSALAFGANPMVSAYAAIAVNIYAINAAFTLLTEAASFSRLQEQLTSFSAAVTGVDVSNLAVKLREASAGALSLKESLSFSTKGVAFSFTTDQLEKLTASTRKASIALGRDFTDSMDRVLRGISKQEIELFDELGIVTRLTPAFQKYAAEVGKTVDELTNYERQLALTNEVQGQLDDKFSGITAGATAWEILGVNAQDATNDMLVLIAKGLEPAAAWLNKIGGYLGSLSDREMISKEAATSAEIFSKALDAKNLGAAVTATGAITGKIADLKKQFEESKKSAEGLSRTMGGLGEDLAISAANVATEFAGLAGFGLFNEGLRDANEELKAGYSETARYYNELKKQKVIQDEILELEKERAKQISILAGREITDPIDEKTGASFIAYVKALDDGAAAVDGLALAGQKSQGPLRGIQDALNEIATITTDVAEGALKWDAIIVQAKKFEKLKVDYGIAESLDGVGKLEDAVDELAKSYSELSSKDDLLAINTGAEGEALSDLKQTIKLRQNLQDQELDLGTLIAKDTNKKREAELVLLRAKLLQLEVDTKLAKSLKEQATSSTIVLNSIAQFEPKQSQILRLQVASLEANIKNTKEAGKSTREQEAQKKVLEDKLVIQKGIEASRRIDAAEIEALKEKGYVESQILDYQIGQLEAKLASIKAAAGFNQDAMAQEQAIALQSQITDLKTKNDLQKVSEDKQRVANALTVEAARLQSLTGSKGSEQARVKHEQEILDLKLKQAASISNLIERQKQLELLSVEQGQLNKEKEAAPYKDASTTMDAMASLPGVEGATKTALELGSTFSNAFASAAESGEGFTEHLMGNMEAFQAFSEGIASALGSVFQASSDAKIAGIDQEIAAEKKRDGKSAESLAKLKALEAKKIKERAKASKAQVVISTATAIAMAFAELGFIAGIPAAAVLAGMGILQIAAINKAANGQISALDSGAGGGKDMKIEGGNRKNDVDVSRNANAGELSFINGGAGQGTANNFITPGRAGGGTSSAGASIIVGERGAEEITPLVPVSVTPAGSSSGGGGMVFSPVFNVEAMDSAGFEAVTSRFSEELYNSLEVELRARNLTLDSLA